MRVLILVLLAGCTQEYEPYGKPTPCREPTVEDVEAAYLITEDAYADHVGYSNESCRDQRPVDYQLVTDDDFPECCKGKSLLGCVCRDEDSGEWRMWLGECLIEPQRTIRHERLHVLLACDGGDADADHSDHAWGSVAPR